MKPGKTLTVAVGIGLLWGMTEATVGTLLHLIPYPIGVYLWFPIAYGYMRWSALQTRTRNAVLLSAAVAATVKLLGLFSSIRIDYVLNPAISILLEGLSLWMVWRATKPGKMVGSLRILLANMLWRAGYLVCMLALPLWIKQFSPLSGWQAVIRFMLVEWAISSAVAVGLGGFVRWARKQKWRSIPSER